MKILILSIVCMIISVNGDTLPCYTTINDVNYLLTDAQVIETPCYATIFDNSQNPFRITFRSYPAATSLYVEASILDDPGNTYSANLFFTSSYVFGYFTGDYNQGSKNLTNALTAPLILRPVSEERVGDLKWVAAMALAPSLWPAGSSAPKPTLDNMDVKSYDDLVMASVPVLVNNAPTEDDFRSAYQQLETYIGLLALPGQWIINITSPFTPSFNYYFTDDYNGTYYLIEAAAEVYYKPPAHT
jgi:hypothetical protein